MLKIKKYVKTEKNIFEKDDWYIYLEGKIKKLIIDYHNNKYPQYSKKLEKIKKEREKFINLVSKNLDLIKSKALKDKEFYFDKNRKTIDTIVIHHTGRHFRTSLNKIETLNFLIVYVTEFLYNNEIKGLPIFSGHYYKGITTFFAYHYIVFNNGSYINPLKDEYIGWHSGNKEYNEKSIAICIHDNLENKYPNTKVINTICNIISKYKNIKEIVGHSEIKKTTCPGSKFNGDNGWKQIILNKLKL